MSRRLLLGVVSVAVLAYAVPASALQILPIADDRIISVTLQGSTTLQEVPGPGFPDFTEFVGFVGAGDANQQSTIGLTQMTGSGGDFTDGAGDTSGFSVFDIRFQVDEVVAYVLNGSVYGYGLEGPDLPTVTLSGPGGVLFEPALPPGVGPHPFEGTGALSPGVEYRLVVASAHQGGTFDGVGGEGHDWNFDFTIAVPEPATGLLQSFAVVLAAALAGTSGSRRRGR